MAFTPNSAKLAAYRSTSVHSGLEASDPHRLIVMLMDGALERLATARGLMQNGTGSAEKAQLLHRAHRRAAQQPQPEGGRRHLPQSRFAVRLHVHAHHAGERV
jgi:hypothetical protein